MQITGQISKVSSFPGKYGDMYSITVDGKNYGTGKNAMGANQGDWVTFSATENARGYLDVDKGTLKPSQAPKGAVAPAASAAPSSYSGNDQRQQSIIRQSSRKDAVEFVKLLAANGAIDFGKAKSAQKAQLLETYIDKYTDHFVEEIETLSAFDSQETGNEVAATDDGPNDPLPF